MQAKRRVERDDAVKIAVDVDAREIVATGWWLIANPLTSDAVVYVAT